MTVVLTTPVKAAPIPTDTRFVPSPDGLFQKTLTTQDRLEVMSKIRAIMPDVAELAASHHQNALDAVLASHTSEVSLRSAPELLNELSDDGFAWSDIARIVGVSVPALRKWRLGESDPTGMNRSAIARFVAFVRMLQRQCGVEHVASWLEMPLVSGFHITAMDLLLRQDFALIFEVAAHRMTSEVALDRFEPNWRRTTAPQVEVFVAEDGGVAIRPKN